MCAWSNGSRDPHFKLADSYQTKQIALLPHVAVNSEIVLTFVIETRVSPCAGVRQINRGAQDGHSGI
jgi:hypothetical protein